VNKSEKITIEVIAGVEGSCLAINNYRFAGPKPWGGGRVTKQWKVTKEDFIESLKHIGFDVEEVTDEE